MLKSVLEAGFGSGSAWVLVEVLLQQLVLVEVGGSSGRRLFLPTSEQ